MSAIRLLIVKVLSLLKVVFVTSRKKIAAAREVTAAALLTRIVSLVLLTSILSTSTFAAVPGIGTSLFVSINEIGQDFRFGMLSNSPAVSIFSWETLALIIKPFKSSKQIAPERIVILPTAGESGLTVVQGETVNFSAIGLGRDGYPMSGLPFKWTITDTGKNRPPRPLNGGNFTAKLSGTFIITAETAGKQAQLLVTVNPNEGYSIQKLFRKKESEKTEKDRQFIATLKEKGTLISREISSKGDYKEEDEKRLYEADKKKREDVKIKQNGRRQKNPNAGQSPKSNGNPNQNTQSNVDTDKSFNSETQTTETYVSGVDRADAEGMEPERNTVEPETSIEEPLSESPEVAPVIAARPMLEDGWDGNNWWTADEPYNQIGNPPGASPDAIAGSGNFQMSAPVIALPGRGIDINLSLSYNSKLWSRSGNTVSYDSDQGFPGPGWSLGFGKMINMGSNGGCMLVDADGTRRGYSGVNDTYSNGGYYSNYFTGHTADGSFIDYSCHYASSSYGTYLLGWASLPNGTKVYYQSATDNFDQVYPTQITDAQGNYITITYVNNRGPQIQTITDTMGRVITFVYDSSNRLIAVTAPKLDNTGTRTVVRLHYSQINLNYGFAAGIYADTPTTAPTVLDAIYYPGTGTGYWFGNTDSYSGYGMLAKVVEQRGMSWSPGGGDQGTVTPGAVTKQAVYSYPMGPDYTISDAPHYTTLTESWAGMNTAPAITQYSINNNDSHSDGFSNAACYTTMVTQPNGTISKQYAYRAPGSWVDGLIFADETVGSVGGTPTVLSSSIVSWQQGAYDTARPAFMITTDERQQTTRTDLTYGSNYNQLISKKEYDYNNGGLLRETRTEYENHALYTTNKHIFNLVKANEVYDGNGSRIARNEYEFDNNALGGGSHNLKATPGVIMHNYWNDPYTSQTQDGPNCAQYGQFSNPQCSYDGEWVYVWNGEWYDPEYCERSCDAYEQVSAYDSSTAFRGNVTKVISYPDAVSLANPIINTKQYDVTGNAVTESASCCELKTYDFTSATQYAYPTSASRGSSDPNSPIRNTSQFTYDYNTGLMKTSTDPNGRTDTNNYDAETLRPTIPVSSTGAYTVTGYYDASMEMIHEVHEAGGNLAGNTITTLNGLGQVVRTAARGVNNVWDYVSTEYDNMGRLKRQSKPYRNGDTIYWTEVEYDPLGRQTQVTAPDGSVSRAFYNETQRPNSASSLPGETVRNMDAWGRERWARNDALGRLVEVVEPSPNGNGSVTAAGNMVTRYAYNALGNLMESNQGGGQMRYFRYDSLGRMTKQKLPEQSATLNDAGQYIGEGAAGAYWSGAVIYDNRSNIVQRTDARGVKTNYSYQLNGADDPLNRLQSVSYDLSGPHDTSKPIHTGAPPVTYQYMTSGDRDRLWKAVSWNTTSEFTYNDAEGRVSDSTQTLTSRSSYPMVTSYIYDSLNRVTDVRYPAQYGAAGSPRKLVHNALQIGDGLSALTVDGQTQASDLIYNAAGQTTQMKVGAAGASQLTEEYSFDQRTGLMLNQKVKNAGGGELLNLDYSYQRRDQNGNLVAGKTGNLAEIVNNLDHNKDRRYEYDALGRLTKAAGGASALGQGSSSWTQTYVYDIFGNRTSVAASGQTNGAQIPTDGIANLSYNTLTNRITTAGFEYDANGNQTRALAPDGQTWYRYEYDDANRLVYIKQDNGTLIQTQEFGVGNNRISVTDAASGQKTYYHGGAVEYTESNNNGVLNWSKSFVYLGDSLLSTTTPNGSGGETVEYHHPDALGTRLVSNPQTGSITENVNLPFGTQIQNESTNVSSKRKFTSYDRSSVTGLDYAQNRTYDSKQGRFTQVDPIGMSAASLMNPQSLNMYAYCGNDPVNHTDPSGLFWGKLFKWISKAFKWIMVAVIVATAVLTVVGTFMTPVAFGAFLNTGLGQALSFIAGLPNAIGNILSGASKTVAGIFNLAAERSAAIVGWAALTAGSSVGSIGNYYKGKSAASKQQNDICSKGILIAFDLGDSKQYKSTDEENINYINADAAAAFDAALQEINQSNGTIAFADVFRDSEMQQRRFNRSLRGGPPASRPGNGAHEAGMAVDVYMPNVNDAVVKIFEKHGWERSQMRPKVKKKEPWHFQWKGFSGNMVRVAQDYYKNCVPH